MNTQPEALRLATILQTSGWQPTQQEFLEAAAELRRLHEVNQMLVEAGEVALEALENNRRNHYYCEDTWYSCPKHEDGCANDSEGNECNCGADKANQEIESAIAALRQALAKAKEQA